MIRFVFLAGLALVFLGCDSNNDGQPLVFDEPSLSKPSSPPTRSTEPKWRRFGSNEWYEIYELRLSENQSLICLAIHKSDAQLGIPIAVNIARVAETRGFKFFREENASPTKMQTELIDRILPEGLIDEAFYKIDFLLTKPLGDDRVVDVASFSKIPLDWDEQKKAGSHLNDL